VNSAKRDRLLEEGSIARKLKICRGQYDSLFFQFGNSKEPWDEYIGTGLYGFFDTAFRARYIGQGDIQARYRKHIGGHTAAGKVLKHTSDYLESVSYTHLTLPTICSV